MAFVQDKIVVILSGYNIRAVISFIRTLENYGIKYAIVAKNKNDQIFLTKYKNNVIFTRKNNELSVQLVELFIVKFLSHLQQKH